MVDGIADGLRMKYTKSLYTRSARAYGFQEQSTHWELALSSLDQCCYVKRQGTSSPQSQAHRKTSTVNLFWNPLTLSSTHKQRSQLSILLKLKRLVQPLVFTLAQASRHLSPIHFPVSPRSYALRLTPFARIDTLPEFQI